MARAVFLLLGISIGLAAGYLLWFERVQPLQQPDHADSSPAAPEPTPAVLSPFEALVQRINTHMADGEYAVAIEQLIEADLVAAAPRELEQLEQLLDEAVDARVHQLREREQLAAVDALYERLSLIMPERAEFYILLAEHRIDMGNPEAALPVLAQIENHGQLGALARDLIEQISSTGISEDMLASLPVTRSGNQFIVPALLDGSREVSLLIDTGASVTTLSPGVLQEMGYDLSAQQANFATASGVVLAPVVRVRAISLGPATVGAVAVGALAFERPGGAVDGLLGMNVLRHFEFSLDQEAARLNLHASRTD